MLTIATVLAFGLALTACKKHEMPMSDKAGGEHKMEAAKYACPMHPEVTDAKASKCSKCGMALKPVMTSSMEHGKGDHKHASATEATIKVSVTTKSPLQPGEKTEAILRLSKKDGSPVLLSDLKEAHTKKIHLLINESSLTDYHHEHTEPTGTPGEYAFSFTPLKPGPYRVWADLVPVATDTQEYSIADIAAPMKGEPITEREVKTVDMVEGLKYEVVFNKTKLIVGEATMGKLKITRSDGKVFDQLEPIMATYAHLVAFGEDYKSIVHIHPMGAEPTKDTDRGTGNLEFHIQPEKPGLMRLYAQVQIGGVSKFARFTLQVLPNLIEGTAHITRQK